MASIITGKRHMFMNGLNNIHHAIVLTAADLDLCQCLEHEGVGADCNMASLRDVLCPLPDCLMQELHKFAVISSQSIC